MATGSASNSGKLEASGAEGGNLQSRPLSNEESVQVARFLIETVPRLQRQERLVQQLNVITLTGFIVLLITVAALVISCVLNYTQTLNDVSQKNTELLNRMNEQLIRLEESVNHLEKPQTK